MAITKLGPRIGRDASNQQGPVNPSSAGPSRSAPVHGKTPGPHGPDREREGRSAKGSCDLPDAELDRQPHRQPACEDDHKVSTRAVATLQVGGVSKAPHLSEREATVLRSIRKGTSVATASELNSLILRNLVEQASPTGSYEPRLTAIGIRALDRFDEGL